MKDGEAMEIVVSEESTALEVQTETGALLQMAVSKDLDVDKLEKLIELKTREEDRKCKQAFDRHFTEMQAEFEPIDRTKDGYNCKYAPLPLMVKKYAPIISKHGFSYKWRETAIENGKRVTIIISGWGHTDDETFFDVPIVKSTGSQNEIQVMGTMSSYGNRYTFKSGFGITEIDEDTDGNLTFDDGVKYAREIEWIRTCKTPEDLKKTWKEVWTELANDKIGRDVLTVVYNEKKKEFIK